MLVVSLLALGCTDADRPRTDRYDTDTSAKPTHPTDGSSTDETGDTAIVVPPPQWPDDCDPHVRVPALGGEINPQILPDPHAQVLGASPAPFAVRYSWPGSDPSTSAAFLWRTDVDTRASLLELGTGSAPPVLYEGASFTFGGTGTGQPLYRTHEVRLCQKLEPATTYQYRVGGAGAWSELYHFTTPAPPGTFDTVRVAIAGDSRGSYGKWATIVTAANAFDPDFFLFTGDAVTAGSSQVEWDYWLTASADLFAGKALVPAHGNHEALALNWFAQVALPNNELWYTIRYGPLEIAVLNDSSVDPSDRELQAAWLADRLGGSTAPWRLAAHHQALYSANTRHGSNQALRASWAPVYDKVGMDLVFNGHNHTYERSIPVFGDAPASAAQGVTYVVTGGAGAPLYTTTAPEWFTEIANPIEHFLIVDFGPEGAHAVTRDLSGNVIDEFELPFD